MSDKWDEMFVTDELPELFKNVEQAKALGKEGFINVLAEAGDVAMSDGGLPYLLTGLVIGNMAFDAKPQCSIALTGNKRVFIEIQDAV